MKAILSYAFLDYQDPEFLRAALLLHGHLYVPTDQHWKPYIGNWKSRLVSTARIEDETQHFELPHANFARSQDEFAFRRYCNDSVDSIELLSRRLISLRDTGFADEIYARFHDSLLPIVLVQRKLEFSII
jgi:hypothetical protein